MVFSRHFERTRTLIWLCPAAPAAASLVAALHPHDEMANVHRAQKGRSVRSVGLLGTPLPFFQFLGRGRGIRQRRKRSTEFCNI
jgi:hypothetical protein